MKDSLEKLQIDEDGTKDARHTLSYQEAIITSIGNFGRTQFIILVAVSLTRVFGAWSMIMMSFAGAQPDWWTESTVFNETSNLSYTIRKTKTCPESGNETIVFGDNIYTIVSEWSLVCSRDWIPTTITTIQMVGVLFGAAVIGQLGDWIGRKRALLFAYIFDLCFILLLGLSVNWQMMAVAAFFLGFSLGGYLSVIGVYIYEFIGTEWRTSINVVPGWEVGVILFGAMFKLLPNWRHLCYATTALGGPVVFLFCFSPESVRWYLTHNKVRTGKKVLRRIARRNGKPEPDMDAIDKILSKNLLSTKESMLKYNYVSLIRNRSTRYKAFILHFMWMGASFTYYGLTLGVGELSGDISLNMALMGLSEAFCVMLVWPVSKCLARKYTTIFFLVATSLASFGVTIAYFVTTEYFDISMNVLALVSRLFLAASWNAIVIFTTESFPTVLRSSAHGFVNVGARIGGIMAPQNKTLSKISRHLPFTVNGIVALVSAFLCLFLEDTYHAVMTDEIEEEEKRSELSTTKV